jgi:hypothetical protein
MAAPRYKEGVSTALLALAYATRKNQDEEVPERMEIDFVAMDHAISKIISSSFLNENDVVVFPKDPVTLNKLVAFARLICD